MLSTIIKNIQHVDLVRETVVPVARRIRGTVGGYERAPDRGLCGRFSKSRFCGRRHVFASEP